MLANTSSEAVVFLMFKTKNTAEVSRFSLNVSKQALIVRLKPLVTIAE